MKKEDMNCVEFEKKLIDFQPGDEPGVDFLLHLEGCRDCNTLAKEMSGLYQLMEVEKSKTVSPFLTTRVMAALSDSKSSSRFSIGHAWQVAAVFLALVAGFNIALFLDSRSSLHSEDVILSEYFVSGNVGMEIENNWFKLFEDETNHE